MSEFEYCIREDNKIEIIKCYNNESTVIVIPNMIDGYDVS